MRVTVFGSGYVGLVIGVCLADFVNREGFQYFAIGRGDRLEPFRENAG